MEPTTSGGAGVSMKMVGIILGAVVLVGVGYVALNKSSGGESMMKGMEMATPAEKMSLKQLLGGTGSQKCTFSEGNDLSRSSGTFYTSGGKGRGDFESEVMSGPGAGVKSTSHMITDGSAMHVWDDTTQQGMKMMMADMPETKATGGDKNLVADQWNQVYDYDCETWSDDAAMFTPPATIQFMDMGAMMKGMPMGVPSQGGKMPSIDGAAVSNNPTMMDGANMMTAQCSACDQAGDQKAACRAALGCK